MKLPKYATVAGVAFKDDSVSAARAKGEQSIKKFVMDAHDVGPTYYRVGHMMALIWPIIDGWAWRLIEPDDRGGNAVANCTMGGTRADAVTDAVSAAVQRQWSLDCVDDVAFCADGFAALLKGRDENMIALAKSKMDETLSLFAWQRRYAAVVAKGADKCTAHEIACKTSNIEQAISMIA